MDGAVTASCCFVWKYAQKMLLYEGWLYLLCQMFHYDEDNTLISNHSVPTQHGFQVQFGRVVGMIFHTTECNIFQHCMGSTLCDLTSYQLDKSFLRLRLYTQLCKCKEIMVMLEETLYKCSYQLVEPQSMVYASTIGKFSATPSCSSLSTCAS